MSVQMTNAPTAGWSAGLGDRLQARLSTRAKAAGGFVTQPEPRCIGSVARGRQMVSGNFLFAGYLVEGAGSDLWSLPVPAPQFEAALHGFSWLDDLAALGTGPAIDCAQDWTWAWITRFGSGRGAGWTPALAGRRMIRWISHALLLLPGRDTTVYFTVLGAQTAFLARRWSTAPTGLPRFEALCGLLYAGLSLTGMDRHIAPALRALEKECAAQIDGQGGLPTRNPEELLEVFALLTWVAQALDATDRSPGPEHGAAMARITPTLRALRHADGSLARFHGGGRGLEGRLDHALATTRIRATKPADLAMGYTRLGAGRTTVIVDTAPPPSGAASLNAHASTLGFELTSGRRALIVNCGSGATFGETWRRAGRATPSHSTLGIDGVSSSKLAAASNAPGQEGLTDVPRDVRLQRADTSEAIGIVVGHDGYVATHGLTHVRKLTLSRDGRALLGEETLGALTEADRERFAICLNESRLAGVPFAIRFHLHPDVDPRIDMDGTAVSMALRSGEVWVFRHDGTATLKLETSVYLESGRLKPRATRQIVLAARVTDYARQIGWTLAKASDTPQGVRDLVRDEDDFLTETEPT